MVAICLILSACAQNDQTRSSNDITILDDGAVDANRTVYPPRDYTAFIGMNYVQAESLLREAGFGNIAFSSLNDIDSNSIFADGSIQSITINGVANFTIDSEYRYDTEVLISYHSIPRITAPMTSVSAVSQQYMDVGKTFFQAGFTSIETDEVYDRPPQSEGQTLLTASGLQIVDGEQLPFDCDIRVIGHYPVSAYKTYITIDFERNWILNKYDVIVSLNGQELSTLAHGESTAYNLSLTSGHFTLSFTKAKDSDIVGSVEFDIDCDTTLGYHISCNAKSVDVKETEFTRGLNPDELLMPYSSNHYLRKDYQKTVDELNALGFKKVTAFPTTDNLWVPSDVNSVVKIAVGDVLEFGKDKVFNNSSPVSVYYHVADFAFVASTMQITEKETFEIPYTMTSGDKFSSLLFEIDDPNVLQRNDDGTYTALRPGNATVTVSSGGHVYSTCKIEVTEIIVPIEKLIFKSNDAEVVVGSTFTLDYKVTPENANYTDMTVVLSGTGIEQGENYTFYANEAGDTEANFYQDDRMIGSCVIHAITVDIEDLVFTEPIEEMSIGDTTELSFTLYPEIASCKGISVVSSDDSIIDVTFDERGSPSANLKGLSAGSATITVTIPNGTKYTQKIQVKEVNPDKITITNTKPTQRIEVGTPIALDIKWEPNNTSIKELKWSSSNSSVIKVTSDGFLEAVGVGTADITAKHKSGVTDVMSLTVEPTLVTKIELNSDQENGKDFIKGDHFTIIASVIPSNATNQSIVFTSSDDSVIKVSERGVVTAVAPGTAIIKASSPDGPSQDLEVTVSPSPQTFRISYNCYIVSNDSVGSRWSQSFTVDSKDFYSGSTISIKPGGSFTVRLTVQDNDSNPDVGYYTETFTYSEDLCRQGRTLSGKIPVRENGGRYKGNYAEWEYQITITPVS